ncbi:hypothetical protein [Micromonospora echinofusca]
MEQRLTDEEKTTLKTAAFGAVFLVSDADPGLFAMIKESFAASGAIAGTSGLVKEVLTTGALPSLPRRSSTAVEATVLPGLRRAVAILQEKAPEEVEPYRRTVLDAADAVARAHRGIAAAEAAAIAWITDALALPD